MLPGCQEPFPDRTELSMFGHEMVGDHQVKELYKGVKNGTFNDPVSLQVRNSRELNKKS